MIFFFFFFYFLLIILFHFIFFFFFNDTATTEIYTLSLHDALPISAQNSHPVFRSDLANGNCIGLRSEEHTSELQSLAYLVCRLLLEKKKNIHLDNRRQLKKKRNTQIKDTNLRQ